MARGFIAWFGPRGLSSLLLALLAVSAGVPGAETVLALAGVVVTVSVVLHGISATPLTAWYAKCVAEQTLDEERVSTASEMLRSGAIKVDEVPMIDGPELVERLASPDPPVVLDVRSRSSFEKDPEGIPGDVRIPPDQVESWAAKRKHDRAIVAYCT
jgi:NhaP-type Na+/H+ or K+/H+ antiporter